MTVSTEQKRALTQVERIEQLEDVVVSLDDSDPRRTKINTVVMSEIKELSPMRATIAAQLLDVSEKTVRAWVEAGVLTPQTRSPRLLIDPARVIEARRIVRELRSKGRVHDLLDELYFQLSDRDLVRSAEFVRSAEQMRRGEGRKVQSRLA
jgi:DNA-binding transcriptional MerR regulator